MNLPKTVNWVDGKLILVDQRRLPDELVFIECNSVDSVADAIRSMAVRGAPAIGVAAAFGLAIAARSGKIEEVRKAADILRSTRPTAVNLFWAIDRVMRAVESSDDIARAAEEEAIRIMEEDIETNRRIGEIGSSLIDDGMRIMTICNAGSLATVYYGTALAPIYVAWENGKKVEVIALETRPVLQGARITAFELMHAGIPVKLIVDGAAGYVMRKIGVDLVLVGADRILSDGTVYNKIGTYNLAVLAKRHKIPFYSVAPTSTFDLRSRREDVRIEQRPAEEVTKIRGVRIAPDGVDVINPAFDETPPDLLTGIITEKGIIRRPFRKSIRKILIDH
ncbi:MAG: S-methyl-5-thioribose-1-phosphate isomerase [Candidatus Methanodesulfokora sp.]